MSKPQTLRQMLSDHISKSNDNHLEISNKLTSLNDHKVFHKEQIDELKKDVKELKEKKNFSLTNFLAKILALIFMK